MAKQPNDGTPLEPIDLVERSLRKLVLAGAGVAAAVLGGTGYNVLRPTQEIKAISFEEHQASKEAVWTKIRTMDDARTEIKTNVAVIATQVSNLTANVDKFVAAQQTVNEKHEATDDELRRDIRELERKP